jgi:hypothetical protein
MKKFFGDHQFYNTLAVRHWNYLKKMFPNDPKRLAYSWFAGEGNGKSNDTTEAFLDSHEYPTKYMKLLPKFVPQVALGKSEVVPSHDSVSLTPGAASLKKLLGFIEANGGALGETHTKNLPRLLQPFVEQGGILTTEPVKKLIEKLPKHIFGVTQSPRNDTQLPKSMNLHLTPDHVQELEEAGLWPKVRQLLQHNEAVCSIPFGGNVADGFTAGTPVHHLHASVKNSKELSPKEVTKVLKTVFGNNKPEAIAKEAFEEFMKQNHGKDAKINKAESSKIELDPSKAPPTGEELSKELAIVGDEQTPPDEQFDSEQLRMGIEHEMEHTQNLEVAKKIAKDHLKESPRYYTDLQTIEKNDDPIASRIKQIAATTNASAWKKGNMGMVVSRDPHNPNQWRVTPVGQGGKPSEHSVYPTYESALATLGDAILDEPYKFYPKKEELDKAGGITEAGHRHHLNLPVGTIKHPGAQGTASDGKMKVQTTEGKAKWRGIRSGIVMAPDGTPTSSRNPNPKSGSDDEQG